MYEDDHDTDNKHYNAREDKEFERDFTAQYLSEQRSQALENRLRAGGLLEFHNPNSLEPIDARRGLPVPKPEYATWDANAEPANTEPADIAPSPLLERTCDELAILLHSAGYGDGSAEGALEIARISVALLAGFVTPSQFQQLKTEFASSQSHALTIDVQSRQ